MQHHIRQLVSDVECRRELGGVGRVKWGRWEKAFADIFPPAIVIRNRKHRDRDAWERCKEALIARSDHGATRAAAARARAARRRPEAAP